MKKITFLLMMCAGFITAKAQVYNEGDVNVTLIPNYNHDTSSCSSQGTMMYAITVQNSFVGDSLYVVDLGGGSLMYSASNTAGQNPWNLMVPVSGSGLVPDNQVMGGFATFFSPPAKVVCGPDTIRNIDNTFQLAVPAPCTYGTVTGKIYVDNNGDCSFNTGDVPLSVVTAFGYVNLNSPSITSTTASGYSNGSGDYSMQVQETWMTDYNVYIPSNYQFIFPSTACSPVTYNFTSLPQSNVGFSLQCTSNIDVQCYAGSNGAVRPGIPFFMHPYVSNTGCDSASGQLKLVLDPRVTYNAGLSSNPAASISGDTLIWNYSGLTNLTNGAYWNSFFSGIHLTPGVSVNIGDVLCFRVMTNVPAMDVDPSNNDYTICLPVVNSYDPNVKEVSPKGTTVQGYIPQSTEELTYTVHFQNTGTAAAYNIKVIDTLDTDILPGSLEILGTSHSATATWLSEGIVQFDFYNIMLPDSTSNEALSHGFVSFKVKLNPGLAPLTHIKNTAHIYFDFNPAIVTNTVVNTIEATTGIEEISQAASVTVYPNPFTDNTTFVINGDQLSGAYSVELTDVLGKTVRSVNNISDKQFTLSRNGLQNGVYFYKIYAPDRVIGIGKLIIK